MSRERGVMSDAVDSETRIRQHDRVGWQLLDNAMRLHGFTDFVLSVHGVDLRQQRTAALHLVGNHQLGYRPHRRAMLVGCWWVSFLQGFRRRKCNRRPI